MILTVPTVNGRYPHTQDEEGIFGSNPPAPLAMMRPQVEKLEVVYKEAPGGKR